MIPAMLVDLSSQMQRNSANWFCTPVGASFCTEGDEHGSMGSGFIFSLWSKVLLKVFKAWDMCLAIGVEDGGRDERGSGLERHSVTLFMCELGLGFELWNSAIISWAFSISMASSH